MSDLESLRARSDSAAAELARVRAALDGHLDDATLAPWLERGEPVLWVGRPEPLQVALRCLPGAFAGLLVVGAVVLLSVRVPLPSLFFWFFLIGLGLAGWLVVRPLVRAWQARHTRYAVTARRALVVSRGVAAETRSFRSWDLADVTVRADAHGFGDVLFRPVASGFLRMPTWIEVGFLAVNDAPGADRALRRISKDGP